ncbi:MAG: sensor histidine kinase [Flavobacteriales bacterium]|jgi:signal transduction histidine kinase|nr:sensor histidine kinase [Flavobacteriales bacterium]
MKFLSLFILFLIPFISFSVDKDSLAIEQILKRSLQVVYSNPDSAFIYCQEAEKQSKESLFFKSKTLLHYGIYYDVTSRFDSSVKAYNQALELAQKGNHISIEASALNNLGLIHWNQSNFDLAIEYYNKSILQFEKINKKNGIASTLNNIGLIYNELKNYRKAIDYYYQSLALYQEIEDQYGMSAAYSNLAIVYSNLRKSDSAYYFFQQSTVLKHQINDQWGIATNYTNLAVDFHLSEIYDSSLFYNRKAEVIYRNIKNKNNLASCLSGIGRDLLMLKRYSESEQSLIEAEQLALETNAQKYLRNIYDHFSELYYYTNQHKKAYEYLKKRLNIGNTIYNTEKDRTINEIQTKYETAKKDKELAEQKEEILRQELTVKTRNIQLLTIIGVLFIVITITIIILQNQLNKRKKLQLAFEAQEKIKAVNHERELAEDKLRISRDLHDNIGSHLTFLITSIDNLSYAETSEQKKAKMEKISNFGRDTMKELRSTIWAMKNEGSSLQELIYKIIDLKAHIPIPIHINEHNSSTIKLTSIQILNSYRIVQEAIQNTTKYANATEITIHFKHVENNLNITIIDNGKGFDIDTITPRGILNMQHRCELLNGDFSLKSNASGTVITCRIPI